MRILFSGGGTGGHINPALAVAKYIKEKEPDTEILYVGATGGIEEKLVPAAGIAFKSVTVSGFQRKLSVKNIGRNIRAVVRVFTGGAQAKKIIREFAPDAAFGTGGYVCGPVLLQCAKMGIPVFVHESNSFPGVTVKMLAKHAKCVMLGNEDAKKYLEGVNTVITGNPVRPEILAAQSENARKMLSSKEFFKEGRPLVLSFGGSLGARKINEAAAELLARSFRDKKYSHIHGYGKYSLWMPDLLKEKGVDTENPDNIDLREYINDMDICLAAADIVISRAGAISLSEIQAKGKAAILIPSPNVAENHQYKNAMSMVVRGAAEIIEEKDLTPQKLMETVDSMIEGGRYLKIGENAAKMAILDANERIYREIKKDI